MTPASGPLERIHLADLERIETCPPSRGSGSELPRLPLERWKAVREAVVEWHHAGRPMDTETQGRIAGAIFDGWDPIQRGILEGLFAAYRRLFPDGVIAVDLDPPPGVAIHQQTNRSINVGVHIGVQTAAGWQAVRIRTGRRGTTTAEAAAFYQAGEDRILVDMRLATDDVVTIAVPDAAGPLIDDVAVRWDRAQTLPREGRKAGLHCHICPRPARCGQYPVIGEAAVGRWTRTLLISKTRLADLGRCLRAAAWPSVYGLPRDDGDDDAVESTRLVVGNVFHEAVAAGLHLEDPAEVYVAAGRRVAPSEADDLRWLFSQHETLWATHAPVEVTRTEYQLGVTLVVEGSVIDRRSQRNTGPVAVTMMAVTDVNGWESDRIAAVVEHRTGASSGDLPYEADLYAVSAWKALVALGREVDGVAVHFHHLRAIPARCDRTLYARDDIDRAVERLTRAATELALLDPVDATAPSFTPGQWCEWCEWVDTCLAHRPPPSESFVSPECHDGRHWEGV